MPSAVLFQGRIQVKGRWVDAMREMINSQRSLRTVSRVFHETRRSPSNHDSASRSVINIR
jgi:hypothetical protein